jgi:hypothetical protein
MPCQALLLPCAGVWGIRCTSPSAASSQPFVGIVDCGGELAGVVWAACVSRTSACRATHLRQAEGRGWRAC